MAGVKRNCNFNPNPDNTRSKIKTMKTIALAVTISLGVACLAGCASNSKPSATPAKPGATASQTPATQTPAGTNVLSDEKARVSYAIGMTIGHNFQRQGVEVDADMVARGMKDMLSGGTTLLTQQEMRDTLTAFQKDVCRQTAKNTRRGRCKKQSGRRGVSGHKQNQPGRHHPAGRPAIQSHHQWQRDDSRHPTTS